MRHVVILCATISMAATSVWAASTTNGWDTDVIYVLRSVQGSSFPDGEIRMLNETAPDHMRSDLGKFGADLPDDGKDKSLCFSNSPTPGVNSPAGVRMWCVYNYPPYLSEPNPTDFIVVEYDVHANLLRRFYGSAGVGAAAGELYGPNGRVFVGTVRYNPAKDTLAVSVNVALKDAEGSIVPGSQKGLVYEYALPDWWPSPNWGNPTLVQRYEMPNPHNISGDNGNINSPLVIDFDDDGNMYATNKFFNATNGPPGGGLYWGDVVRCNTLGLNGGLSTYVIPVTGADAGNLIIDAEVEEALGHTDYSSGGQGLAVRAAVNQLVIAPSVDPPTNISIFDLTQRVGGGQTGNLVRVNTAYPSPRMARYAQRDYVSGKIYFGNRIGDGPPGNFRCLNNDSPSDTLTVDVGYFLDDPCEPNCELNRTWDAASPPFSASDEPVCFTDEFAYADGDLNGNGGWSGSATSQIGVVGQTVQMLAGAGAYDATATMSCQDPGTGHIRLAVKVQRGVGSATMWSVWYDDPAGANLARWYGSGTTARGRIGGTSNVTAIQSLTGGWDDLVVEIDPYANTSTFLFNGASIGTLDHSVTGASDAVGRIRLERMDNSGAPGEYLRLDDLMIGTPQTPGDFDHDTDVDQEDFGHLQACFSGSGTLPENGCEDADLDTDRDVDQYDLDAFKTCMNGADLPPGC